MSEKIIWLLSYLSRGYKGNSPYKIENANVHGCGHIMRILQGLNKKTKCIFYVPEMYMKRG